MRRLLLISLPRSGSNWAQDLIGNAPNVLAVREVFGPEGAFGLTAAGGAGLAALRRATGFPHLTERDPRLTAFARGCPERFLAALEDAARGLDRDAISFTLFSAQLPWNETARLMAVPGTRTVLLQRRQLPRYVSLVKARASGVWKHADTTALRPGIDPDAFLAEAAAARDWFARVAAAAPGDSRRIYYEDDLAQGAPAAFRALRRAVPWLVPLPAGREPATTMMVQDGGGDVFDRVAGGPALCAALARSGDLGTALRYPDGTG